MDIQSIGPINPRKVPRDRHERTQWIIYQLKLRRLTLSSVSASHGWARTACRLALHQPYYPAEVAMADVLGTTPDVIFPDRYDRQGRRLHRILGKRRMKDSRAGGPRNVKDGRAA